uniref:Uncharacterized protein n=1 Tax=Utricularia reniformis TaxID=192314 RepID=A0A1Y0AZ09_9LAMI|nr:hypothetical protein AEK19_MT1568 [Utricularia reniformis]ART30388.1 hypothetical protein AEK19_MT1568 [Utricularia reniformis]
MPSDYFINQDRIHCRRIEKYKTLKPTHQGLCIYTILTHCPNILNLLSTS